MSLTKAAWPALMFDVAPDASLVIGGSLGIAFVIGIAAVVVAILLSIKRSLVNSCPIGLTFHDARPESYPALDLNGLERYTRDLEDSGFEEIANYTISAEKGPVQPGFARLFADTNRERYAEINQLFPPNQAVPIRVMIGSKFSNGWSATTTDRTADAGVWLLRRRESWWHSAPGASVEELLGKHAELCHRLASEAGAVPEAPVSVESWYDAERRNANKARETIANRNIVVMLYEYFTYSGQTDWLGGLKTARSNARNDYN